MYSVEYSKKAVKVLQKLDRYTASMIYGWIEKNLEGCLDPRLHGKPLVGDKKGYWRYRIGKYRVIADIDDTSIRIYVINIVHRREVYDE